MIFTISFSLLFLSPGLILSGLYPRKRFLFILSPVFFSNIGPQISSVTPGNTVDSYITILFLFVTFETNSVAFNIGVKFGFFFIINRCRYCNYIYITIF